MDDVRLSRLISSFILFTYVLTLARL
jgi:hypothetical protein